MPELTQKPEIGLEELRKNQPRQQKLAVVFLAFISVSVVVIWALQFNSQVYKPFKAPKTSDKNSAALVDNNLIDSDGDTLTDYEEINTYKTSAYLEDSDSDGINDNIEITQGTNPNCPSGETCNSVEPLITSNSSSSAIELTQGANLNEPISDPSKVTPTLLRQVLLQSGQVSQADLDKISDEDLLISYNEAFKNSQTENQTLTETPNATSTNQ